MKFQTLPKSFAVPMVPNYTQLCYERPIREDSTVRIKASQLRSLLRLNSLPRLTPETQCGVLVIIAFVITHSMLGMESDKEKSGEGGRRRRR